MKYIITESQLKLLHEMSDDVPLFIKRRMLAIKDAIEHAMLPTCVVQPEEYDDDLGYANDVFNAVLDELAWDTYKDGLTPEQEDELYDYLREYYLDAVLDYYHSCVDDEDLFESEDKIISEQSNVYNDKKKYSEALSKYNKLMSAYQMSLQLYKERNIWSKNYSSLNPVWYTPNMNKLSKFTGIASSSVPYLFDSYYRCKNNLPNDNGYKVTNCSNGTWVYEAMGKPVVEKWVKVPTYYDNGKRFNQNMWIPIVKKPNIVKPIFKPIPPVEQKPIVTPTNVASNKPIKPPTIQSNVDKTKPVDFYFGNRIFRAPDYQMALEFARKLAIKNFNSNMIKIYEHPDNERWFVGQNDKIYLNKNRYDEDPNKNVYIDPVKMGLSAL